MGMHRIEELLSDIRYRDWRFRCGTMAKGAFLQVRFAFDGEEYRGRKWYVSFHATPGEIVQTALAAILAAEEHEARERFRYRGRAIFHPHRPLSALWADAENIETRAGTPEPDDAREAAE